MESNMCLEKVWLPVSPALPNRGWCEPKAEASSVQPASWTQASGPLEQAPQNCSTLLLLCSIYRKYSPSPGGQPAQQWLCRRSKAAGRREVRELQLRSLAVRCGFCNMLVVVQGRHLIAKLAQFQESNCRACR